ncbi:MAG: virulence RhuM family protein [Candidatus Magasanikbacteria bacterium]|nr:virulence RhuM family protein [Candidatus Magasanikbacteria bacterium]
MEDKQIIIYAPDGGNIKIEVPIDGQTVWLSQKQMADLFDCSIDNVGLHLKNIYSEGELSEQATTEDSSVVQMEGARSVKRPLKLYNLDTIISVGYRVNSLRGTQFRIWATQKLREYIIKGFVLDDERLADGRKHSYFDELLERVRAIRASERNFYQKITDIYSTSVDYRKDAKITQEFFATVQNKMHYAIHGHTAAEIIALRVDAKKPHMGLTSFNGKTVREADITVAKNYLSESELKKLNLVVDAYLSFAELQAQSRMAITMKDWVVKFDDFLRLSERDILKNAGKISKKIADQKAFREFKKFRKQEDKNYISDFDQETKKFLKNQLEKK